MISPISSDGMWCHGLVHFPPSCKSSSTRVYACTPTSFWSTPDHGLRRGERSTSLVLNLPGLILDCVVTISIRFSFAVNHIHCLLSRSLLSPEIRLCLGILVPRQWGSLPRRPSTRPHCTGPALLHPRRAFSLFAWKILSPDYPDPKKAQNHWGPVLACSANWASGGLRSDNVHH